MTKIENKRTLREGGSSGSRSELLEQHELQYQRHRQQRGTNQQSDREGQCPLHCVLVPPLPLLLSQLGGNPQVFGIKLNQPLAFEAHA
jgi:hypothetical protein